MERKSTVVYHIRMTREFRKAVVKYAEEHSFSDASEFIRETVAAEIGRPDLADSADLERRAARMRAAVGKKRRGKPP